MNIVVLANRDLASNYALNLLLPELGEHRVRLLLSSSVGSARPRPQPLQQLRFFEQDLFNELLFPLMQKTSSGRFSGFDGFREMLVADPIVENAINSEESVARLRADRPDLVLSIRYGGILRDEVIAIPKQGVINLHSGLLPQYRGVMASFWAMLAGDTTLGTTLHTIDDSSIDTGRVIALSEVALNPGKSYLWQVLNLYPAGVRSMLDAVSMLAAGNNLPATAQPAGGNYFSFPGEAELKAFAEAGHSLYKPGEVIEFIHDNYW